MGRKNGQGSAELLEQVAEQRQSETENWQAKNERMRQATLEHVREKPEPRQDLVLWVRAKFNLTLEQAEEAVGDWLYLDDFEVLGDCLVHVAAERHDEGLAEMLLGPQGQNGTPAARSPIEVALARLAQEPLAPSALAEVLDSELGLPPGSGTDLVLGMLERGEVRQQGDLCYPPEQAAAGTVESDVPAAGEEKVSLAEAFGAVAPDVVENPEALPKPAAEQAGTEVSGASGTPAPAPTAPTAALIQDEPADVRRLRLDSISQEAARSKFKEVAELQCKIEDGEERIKGIKKDMKHWESRIDALLQELTPWAYGQRLGRADAEAAQRPLPLRERSEPEPLPAAPPAQAAPAAQLVEFLADAELLKASELKALSLWQPWASVIAASATEQPGGPQVGKHIETRDWATEHRGIVAIHASKQFKPAEREICGTEPFRTALEAVGHGVDNMPLGAIVAVAELVDVVATTALQGLSDTEVRFGDFGPDRFGWKLERIRRVEPPIPCKGARGLFEVPADVLVELKTRFAPKSAEPEQAEAAPAADEAASVATPEQPAESVASSESPTPEPAAAAA